MDITLKPDPFRLALGFLAAPSVPAAVFALTNVGPDPNAAAVANLFVAAMLYVGAPATIVVGIPLYFLLRGRVRPRLLTVVLIGSALAALPALLLVSLPSAASFAQVGDCVTVRDGVRTACGYLEGLKFLAVFFGFGALGGLTFWLCVVWRDPRLAGRVQTAPG